ncbi:M28 family metallopeptidase [Ekhidna sp.]
MRKVLLGTICIMFTISLYGQQNALMKEQKQMIGEFSGHFPTKDNTYLRARDTPENRAKAADYLADRIKQIGLVPQRNRYRFRNLNPLIDVLFSPFRGENIYTIIPATNSSDQHIVLGAHYDSELNCPGAIDNGTGSTLIYSVGRMLSGLDTREMNLIIVFFDQEEEDLVGSQAFADWLTDEKLNVHSVHTFDMVGWDEDGNREMELELPTTYLENVYSEKAREMDIPLYVTKINSTDHHSFRQAGFDAIGINEAYGKRDTTPFKDTPQDTYETVNFEYLAGSTQYVFEVIKEIINGDD